MAANGGSGSGLRHDDHATRDGGLDLGLAEAGLAQGIAAVLRGERRNVAQLRRRAVELRGHADAAVGAALQDHLAAVALGVRQDPRDVEHRAGRDAEAQEVLAEGSAIAVSEEGGEGLGQGLAVGKAVGVVPETGVVRQLGAAELA